MGVVPGQNLQGVEGDLQCEAEGAKVHVLDIVGDVRAWRTAVVTYGQSAYVHKC